MRSGSILLALAFLVTIGAARPAWAGEAGVELEASGGLMTSWAVQNPAATSSDTTYLLLLSIAGAVSAGPFVAGVNLGGGGGAFTGRVEGFAGGFVGADLSGGRMLVRLVVEGGAHGVVEPGSDSTYHSYAPTVTLPYVGFRLSVERQLSKRRHVLTLGASAFVRTDLGQREVDTTVIKHCDGFDFDCQSPEIPATFVVGGPMIGAGVSLTFGSGR
jgi:hypothetical protein